MSQGVEMIERPPATGPRAVDVAVIARLRRVFVTLVVLGFAAAMFTTASKAGCFGGGNAVDGFRDSTGQPTELAPLCYNLALSASPTLYVLLGGVFLFALNRAIHHAGDTTAALWVIDRTAAVTGIVVVVGIVVSHVWFWQIPTDALASGNEYSFFSPFPFGSIQLDLSRG